MNRIYEAAMLRWLELELALPSAAWDLKSFLANAKSYTQAVGGALLMLFGVAGLIWGGVLLLKKLMGNQQSGAGHGWGQIILLILVGGALSTGGWQLISTIGSGGQATIEDLGNGTVIVQPYSPSDVLSESADG